MRPLKLALAIAIALVCCPIARAQVPKFTIVSITREPPGPLAPGAKFKLKVTVRNDGDTIPANRRFDFIFTTPDALAIAPPTGTPALFFGYCPGATSTNMVCQCFAAWEKGQTVEMETEVTVGASAQGTQTITFTVKSGTDSTSASVTVRVAVNGPDLVPHVYSEFEFEEAVLGRAILFTPYVLNEGAVNSFGEHRLTALFSQGVSLYRDRSKTRTYRENVSIQPGYEWRPQNYYIELRELGPQSIVLTASGGGDVNPSNDVKTIRFEILRETPDSLNRLDTTQKLAEILGR